MKTLYSYGESRLIVHAPGEYTVCILSHRAARFAIRQSYRGLWKYPIVPYVREIIYYGRIRLIGFQPETGFHIAVWDKEEK